MRIIATDDEQLALLGLTNTIRQCVPDAEICGFRSAEDALAFAQSNPCDIAFLDIEMRGMGGIELAKRLKRINPKVNIIFVTGYSQYAGDAFALHASGYVMKPATRAGISKELENLRHPIARAEEKRVRVQTFGNFEVFVDRQPVKFRLGKTKELLAYLIDRKGAYCSTGEILAVLWEDDADMLRRKSYYRDLRADLIRTLRDLGCEEIVSKQRDNLAVVPSLLDCDYYDWIRGELYAINAYTREYMSQYSWAEGTLGELESGM